MKYTWRIILTTILITSNSFIFSNLKLDQHFTLAIIIFIANAGIGWIIGYQLDKYIFSKKELGTTMVTLNDYTFALESVSLGIGITNENGQFEYVNQAHQNLYGYTLKEFLTKNWTDCYSSEAIEELNIKAIPQLLKYGEWQGETIGIRKDGSSFPQEILISNIENTQKMICIVRDITEQKQYLNYIEHIAEHNDLTKLPNRRKLQSDINIIKRDTNDTSLLFIDLDRFKMVNDTLGHNFGDELLIKIAERLVAIQNESIRIYHLGGDEFIVLIKNGNHEYIENIAVEVIDHLKTPYHIFGKEIIITCSIGISRFPEHTNNYDELIDLADTAMYHAKMDGKSTYKFFNEDLSKRLERNSTIESELRKAISKEELYINYQPKCNLVNSKLVGFEALIRWNNPRLGIVSPAEFIPIAEDTGLIIDIGKWIINEVLSQMNLWQSKGYPMVKISVNVSQRQFKENDLVNYIQTCLASHNIDANFFEIEITESLIADFNLIIPQLTALKDLGIGISIDDFGTGYSSLNFINILPIDTLKIDQSFVKALLSNKKNSILAKTIIDIGVNLDLVIIAEGIETKEQLNKLVELNCFFGQGYFFSKPLDALEIESTYLRKNET
ncbi:GGDEF and EAL domain-containing protein [Lysinibacillus sp. SGAir0095]|uniref:sensor domain-containing protein n=1 Tax=Lysinibacillus sp. SGAir0095 TaxID=2070463 RepID=UPI0010CCE648|nr:GGDEF and EAL domain-containing protein [Lysinibacillus sp. SGAir0095]QCR31906.1 GGDEF domain-containing protein [Lysinibacillus sp. SGAir0095]